jgi:hypothetical protein
MWEFLNNLLQTGGLSAVISFVVLFILWRHTKADEKRQDETLIIFKEQSDKVDLAQEKLLELYEKRLQDIKDERVRYEELAEDLDKSLKLVVEVFKEKS